MKDIKLSNLNLYENDNQLYMGFGDGYLSKIEGDDVFYVKEILKNLSNSDALVKSDKLYQELDEKIEIEKDYFDSLLEWLKGNGIITYVEDESLKVNKILNVGIIGASNTEQESIINDINKNLLADGEFSLNLKNADDENIDFCLVFSPMLNKEINFDFFRELYARKTPHLYIDFSAFSVTLGPAINPSLKMHCMNCFFKRRISNTSNPSVYLNLIKLDNNQMRHVSITDSNVYNTLVEWLSNEVIRLIASDWESSGVLGKTKTINFVTDEFNVSRVIKTVNCDVCNERQIYRPLNG